MDSRAALSPVVAAERQRPGGGCVRRVNAICFTPHLCSTSASKRGKLVLSRAIAVMLAVAVNTGLPNEQQLLRHQQQRQGRQRVRHPRKRRELIRAPNEERRCPGKCGTNKAALGKLHQRVELEQQRFLCSAVRGVHVGKSDRDDDAGDDDDGGEKERK